MNKHNFKVGQVYKGNPEFASLNGGRPFRIMAIDPDRGIQRTSFENKKGEGLWVDFNNAAEMWELVLDIAEEPKADGDRLSEVAEERLAEIMRLDRVVDDFKKQLHDAKLGAGLALTAREQAEEALGQTKDQIVGLQNDVDRLKNELKFSEKETSKAEEEANKFYQENKGLKAKIKELEDAVKFERGRLASALEVAESASSGIGAMSRTFHVMTDLVQRIEGKLEK